MKRAKKDEDDEETTGEPSSKKSFVAIPPVNVGPVSTEVCVFSSRLAPNSVSFGNEMCCVYI